MLKDFYDAEVFAEGFTAENINAWVSEKTHGKIEEIVKEIGANTVMYLINALYFKAAWTTAFNEENTREGVFTLSDGTETTADFMSFSEEEEAPDFFYKFIDIRLVAVARNYAVKRENITSVGNSDNGITVFVTPVG